LPVDLDQRLKLALGRPEVHSDAGAALESVLARLPRYRARRRAARLGAASATVVLAAALASALGLSLSGRAGRVGTSAAPVTSAPRCVAVQIAGQPAACIAEQGGAAQNTVQTPAGRMAAAGASGQPLQGLRAVAGSSVRVLLPDLPGHKWTTVSFGPPGSGGTARPLPRRLAAGGSVELVAHATPGVFVVQATAVVNCAGRGCLPAAGQGLSRWSVDLTVVRR
jgi:hypothetical protein